MLYKVVLLFLNLYYKHILFVPFFSPFCNFIF
nr:MAG TPA: hypothetical protein [Caudoviricetes sp.]